MNINSIENSNVTESGNIINPKTNVHNIKKLVSLKEPFFWKGFISGIIASIVASLLYDFVIKPLL